ncbi:hypothetical protein TNCV_4076391 [Trichonephila clavipes]|nr:hypothetical protein TNCV_4076391 [Trichonephila clavipes]
MRGMDVCECVLCLCAWGTLNSCMSSREVGGREREPSNRKPSRMVGGGVERWEAPNYRRYPPSKLGWKRAGSYCHLYGAQSYG